MSEFIVKLDGIKLSKSVEAAISREIQSVVLRHVAEIDLAGDFTARIPRKEWLGIWLRNRAFDPVQVNLQVKEIGR